MSYLKALCLLACSVLIISCTTNRHVVKTLNTNWQFSEKGKNRWLKASVPGTIHTDLLAHNLIPEPFYRSNEDSVQWVSQKDWAYKTDFKVDKSILLRDSVELVFNGLDTYADVFVNGTHVLSANNMFRTWHVPVKHLLRQNNELLVIFRSAEKYVDSAAKAALPYVRPSENNRHYARKAQYNFWWDWAPKMITSGIWKDIQLNAYNGPNPLRIYAPSAENKVRLVQEKDSIGESFYFTVDGKPTYMKGANWVPGDVFLPRMTRARYRDLLVSAKDAGFNMLRVWGGGIYESDHFYELCDSLNIYVWQDMMFAGAIYPSADKGFLENVRAEVRDNVLRLRKYKCIVLWCGNNEIKEAFYNWGWHRQFKISKQDSVKLYNEYVTLFEKVIPEEIARYDSRQYIPTSPVHFGYGHPESLTHGDTHNWWVWVMGKPIEFYKQTVPRFASEFGMQAFPNWETVEKFTSEEDRNFQMPADLIIRTPAIRSHEKHVRGFENLALYLKQNGFQPKTFREYIENTQEVQSRALETAIKAQMNSNGRCMGTLFWQFNDCWPVASWSVIDYYGNKKKAYFTVQKLFSAK